MDKLNYICDFVHVFMSTKNEGNFDLTKFSWLQDVFLLKVLNHRPRRNESLHMKKLRNSIFSYSMVKGTRFSKKFS